MKAENFEQALEGLEIVIGWLVEDHYDLAISAIPPEIEDRRRRLEFLCDFGGDLAQICSAAMVVLKRWELLARDSEGADQ